MNTNTTNYRDNRFFSAERIEPMFIGGKRDWSVDVQRCISCFMVCGVHATEIATARGYFSNADTIMGLSQCVYRMLFASPTVLFVMVSGIFFLSPERNVTAPKVWKKNVVKMAFAYIFWSLIYALYRIHMMDPQPDITAAFFVQQWLVQPNHMWYIPMIVGLYIMCPIIRPITATGDTKIYKYLIIIFLGAMVLWTVYQWPQLPYGEHYIRPALDKTPMAAICQYTFWMIFGWIAYTYRPNKHFRMLIYVLGVIALLIGIYCNIMNWGKGDDVIMAATTQKFSIIAFFKNTALFYFIVTTFRNYKFSGLGEKILKRWSDDTLIIYLIHWLLLVIMFDHGFMYNNGLSPWICVPIYAIISYVAGGIFAEIFHYVWNPIKRLFKREKQSQEK